MISTVPKTYISRRSFVDVDDLTAKTQQWDLDFRQLDCGKFYGELLQFGGGGVHIGEARFSRSLHQKGTPPVGLRTIAVPVHRDIQLIWRDRLIDGQSLMVFPRGSELSSVSGPDFHVYTCSFQEDTLGGVGEILGVGDLNSICTGADAIRVGLPAIEKVRSLLRQLVRSARCAPAASSIAGWTKQLSRDLPIHLLSAIAEGRGQCPRAASVKRTSALKRAQAHIERHATDNIMLGDLLQAVGVSERTLQYAFVERFGIGPKEFLTAFRLSSVRRQLRLADSRRTRVADVANTWGFWHMGQFAADYRQRFHELPSETLQRKAT